MKHVHVSKNQVENADVFIGKAGTCLESVLVNTDLLNLRSAHSKHYCCLFLKANSWRKMMMMMSSFYFPNQ